MENTIRSPLLCQKKSATIRDFWIFMISTIYTLNFSKNNYYLLPLTEKDVTCYSSFEYCPACRLSEAAYPLLEIGKEKWKHVVTLNICKNCNHIYYKNPPSEQAILDYYKGTFLKKNLSEATEADNTVSNTIVNLLDDLNFNNNDSHIFEVGCGNGKMIAGLYKAGFKQVYGCEPSEVSAKISQKRFPEKIWNCGYQNISLSSPKDIIYSSHVVDHLHNPTHFFQWAKNSLTEQGIIIVAVPNAEYEPIVTQALFLPHIHSFTSISLKKLGELYGFECMFWQGARFDELICVYYRSQSQFPDYKKDKFISAEAKRVFTFEELIQRLQQPWLKNSKRTLAFTYPISSFLNKKESIDCIFLNYFEIACLFLLKKMENGFKFLKLESLAIKLRLLLKLIFQNRKNVTTLGYLRIKNSSNESITPRIQFKKAVNFIIK